jgi:peptide/nickel transport system substrate-binding protein
MPRNPNFDPAQNASLNPELTNLFDGLTRLDLETGAAVPALATEWKLIDKLTWEFKLRSGVKFHNGEDFNAAAVKFSADRILDPAENAAVKGIFFGFLAGVQVVDNTTVRITTKDPFGPLPAVISLLSIVPPKYTAEKGSKFLVENPVGTGPYKWVEWVKGQRIVLTANEGYWRGAPPLKKVTFLSAPESSTRIAMLLNNEADLVDGLVADDVARVKGDSKLQVIGQPSSFIQFVTLPTTVKPFDDKRVRQALSYAVDVDSIVTKVLGGYGTRASIANAPVNFGYDASVKPYPYDVAKAKSLLAEAGNPTFQPVQIDTGMGFSPGSTQVMEAVAGYLTAIGLPTKVNLIPNATSIQRFVAGQSVLALRGSNTVTLDSSYNNRGNFLSVAKGGTGVYWSTPQVDDLLLKAEASSDQNERKTIFAQVHSIVKEEAPNIALYTSTYIFGARNDLAWQPGKVRGMPLFEMKFK